MCNFYQIKSKKGLKVWGIVWEKNQKMTFLSPNPRAVTLSQLTYLDLYAIFEFLR